jgi:3-deoxy-D-manno-octulosonate 8-phosphate phosphatase (KDO 8-P phosphatase)
MEELYSRARKIRLVIFDVDGVLTDGSLYIGDDGQEYKAFNSLDGHGMKMLQSIGVVIGIITGRTSKVVEIRMQSLGVEHVYQGRREKLPAYEELKQNLGLKDSEIAFVGDDGKILRPLGNAFEWRAGCRQGSLRIHNGSKRRVAGFAR